MTTTQVQALNAIKSMSKEEVNAFFNLLSNEFRCKIIQEEDEVLSSSELKAIEAYKSGDLEYQPIYSFESVLDELGIDLDSL